jgi:hypothetical protein
VVDQVSVMFKSQSLASAWVQTGIRSACADVRCHYPLRHHLTVPPSKTNLKGITTDALFTGRRRQTCWDRCSSYGNGAVFKNGTEQWMCACGTDASFVRAGAQNKLPRAERGNLTLCCRQLGAGETIDTQRAR